MFLKNTWYVGCKSDEIADKPLARMVCNERMVFFRDMEGTVAAVENFCPHRGAPLSLGTVDEGKLVCGYHGLAVDREGQVVCMPAQRVRGFPAIKSYPVIERHGFVWVWPGDKDKAGPGALIDLPWARDPSWAFGGGVYHIGCDYRLMVDNLMDLTHETYVHASSIGQREIDDTPCSTKVDGDHVVTSRFMSNIMAPPFLAMAMASKGLPREARVDRWQICHFTPPSHVILEVGVALAGKGGYHAADEDKAELQVIDFITPETDQSIWYFWGMARHFCADDDALTAKIRDSQGKIFAEDKIVLEQQQTNLNAYPQRKLLSLNIDSGGVRARGVLDRLLKEEIRETAGQA